ncbi:peptidase [Pandoraea soli]|uniref:Peptidase n=2 Tax=Pandoraea soli TaxID=2508293 RepID=A0ABY6VYH1_9BURK|nr:peptidase [Pandoraea soli]
MGYPAGAWGEAPVRSQMPMKMDDLPIAQLPWAVGDTTEPSSQMPTHDMHGKQNMNTMKDISGISGSQQTFGARIADEHAAHGRGSKKGLTITQLNAQGTLPVDRIIDIAANKGMRSGCSLVATSRVDGVYTASHFPPDPRDERTLCIDQYSGNVLRDIDDDAARLHSNRWPADFH